MGVQTMQHISHGQFYILLYCAKSRNKFLLLNFDVDDIKVNESTLEKMVPMIEESLLSWQHLSIEINCSSMYEFNISPGMVIYNIFSVTRHTQLIPAYFVSQKPI